MALANLTSRWAALDSTEYPGAGFGSLTPDGRLDPLLAYAYDAVVTLAGAIYSVQREADQWGGTLSGFVAERCVGVFVLARQLAEMYIVNVSSSSSQQSARARKHHIRQLFPKSW